MIRFLPFVLLLALGACSTDPFVQDPFTRAGTWAPSGDNDANLRAMVAQPHDLVAGQPMDDSLGAEAARPVARLLRGKRARLPQVSADTVYGAGGGSAAPAAAGGGDGGN